MLYYVHCMYTTYFTFRHFYTHFKALRGVFDDADQNVVHSHHKILKLTEIISSLIFS